jgi:hypothetical protein
LVAIPQVKSKGNQKVLVANQPIVSWRPKVSKTGQLMVTKSILVTNNTLVWWRPNQFLVGT